MNSLDPFNSLEEDPSDILVDALLAGDTHQIAFDIFEEANGARNSRLERICKAMVAEKIRRSATRAAGR